MKYSLPNRFRVWLSKKYLDLFEMLPRFQGGTIAYFQRMRERQREKSKDTYQKSRPPAGYDIEYLYFRLTEVFYLEDIDKLIEAVLRIFPTLDNELRNRDFPRTFQRQANRLSGSSWWNLGYIVRERRWPLILTRNGRIIEDLPPEVEFIHVQLHQVLPSIFALTFDVGLTKDGNKRISELQNRHYLPEIRFMKLIPWDRFNTGYSTTGAEDVMRREINNWKMQLQGQVEVCIKRFINGHFMSQGSNKGACLPVVEIFLLKGSNQANGLDDLEESARWWLDSFGFRSLRYNSYSNDELIFIPGNNSFDDQSNGSINKLIVRWEPYLDLIEKDNSDEDKRYELIDRTQSVLTTILPALVLIELLRFLETNIENLRKQIFKSMRSKWFLGIQLNRFIRLNNVILQGTMFLDRVSKEFNQEKRWFGQEMGRDLPTLKYVRPNKEGGEIQLDKALLETISYRTELLNEHAVFIKEWFTQHLTMRNISATFFLAIVAGIGTLISAILGIIVLFSEK